MVCFQFRSIWSTDLTNPNQNSRKRFAFHLRIQLQWSYYGISFSEATVRSGGVGIVRKVSQHFGRKENASNILWHHFFFKFSVAQIIVVGFLLFQKQKQNNVPFSFFFWNFSLSREWVFVYCNKSFVYLLSGNFNCDTNNKVYNKRATQKKRNIQEKLIKIIKSAKSN